MKKLFFAALLTGASCVAAAQVVAPAGADLLARISSITAHTVDVVVVKPEHVSTVWDEIAANMAGCHITGKRTPSEGGHMSLAFDTLKCAGKTPVAIQAFGVDSVKRRVDLDNRATVGAPLAVLVLADISVAGGKSWESLPR
jgi:hypothetical protein